MKEKTIEKPIADELKKINDTLLDYKKERKEVEEKKDRMWANFGMFRDDLTIFKKKVENLDIELHGTDKQQKNGYAGIVGEIQIIKTQISAIPSTINCLLEPIKKSIEISNENISKINERNLKKDAISNWKLSLPAGLLTILSIVQIIMFFIKG